MVRSSLSKQLVALILSLILVIAFVVWYYTKPNARIIEAAKQVVSMAESIRKSYLNQIDYWGLSTKTAVNNNIFGGKFVEGEKVVNILGKPVLIGSGAEAETIMPSVRSFDIVYTNLSKEECIALASFDYTSAENLGLLKITVVGNNGSVDFVWGEEGHSLPVSRPDAKEICQHNSKIIWTFE